MFTEQKRINPTLQQCIDAGITLGINERSSIIWYEHYAPQGFLFSSGIPMTDIRLAMQRHKNNGTLAGLTNCPRNTLVKPYSLIKSIRVEIVSF